MGKPSKATTPTRRPATVAPGSTPKPARPSPAETALLALARTLTALDRPEVSPRVTVATALDVLAIAFQAGAPLPRALAHARNAALADEARALAIAWAREQLRLSLGEILGRAAAAGDVKAALPAESLAWLALAACEALADEPPHAAPDRVKLLAEWLMGAHAGD
jgi:hypothetical protein